MCLCSLFCSSCERGVLLIQSPPSSSIILLTSKLVPLGPIVECKAAQVEQEVAPVSPVRHEGGRNGTRNCWTNQKKRPIRKSPHVPKEYSPVDLFGFCSSNRSHTHNVVSWSRIRGVLYLKWTHYRFHKVAMFIISPATQQSHTADMHTPV